MTMRKNVAVARALLQARRRAMPVDSQRRADLVAYYSAIAQTLDEAGQELRGPHPTAAAAPCADVPNTCGWWP